ncbi:juvenile hormone esterase-like [Bacillus rossius redtenbacheri]|uniref:juvenile hormone esterase-like n=1 Tax=Bacillus rossius redtenbacheri TaxID=93214 RepID=UPI002FDC8132
MWAALVFLFHAAFVSSLPLKGADGTVTVRTEDGLLRGQVATSACNRTYLSFQAVPFAQPPVGELRFKSPRPAKRWTGVRDALEEGTYCFQEDVKSFITKANMSEDCLYLNVYIPQTASNNSASGGLPVLVWIYGGAFVIGSGIKDNFGPDNLMNRTAILVTFNYRVGALGFLSMEHPDVTSNAALKDQVAALRWVRRNIAHFGGDPDEVTIFGESAGGISVDMHLLSPMSEGLFKRAVSQSGSALAVNFKPGYNATGEAFRLGAALGYNGTDADELVRFLRSVPAQDILKGQKLVGAEEGATATTLIAFPVVDAKTQEGSEVFLPDVPEKLFRAGKVHPVPYITGFNSEEAKGSFTDVTQADLDKYNEEFEQFIPNLLNIEKGTAKSLEIAAKIKSFYFGNKSISFDMLPQLVNLASDKFMIYAVHRSAMFHLKYGSSPVYMYMFTYDGTSLLRAGNYTIKGPAHGADVRYLFYPSYENYSPNGDDMKVIQHFTGMWTDFALSGDPSRHESVKWTPATKTSRTYLQIDADLSLHRDAYKERMAFWDQVFDTYKK